MPESSDQKKREHGGTYVVQDKKSEDELIRLTIQDQMLTDAMGGVLPEQPDASIFERVLDVACGPGGWSIEAAQKYPTMSLVGIDISGRMIEYAREQAEVHNVSDRVEFHIMDALLMLEFPDSYFDVVNLRLGVSFLRTWDWPKMLGEMARVARPGGVIRLTEVELVPQTSTSAAHIRLCEIIVATFAQAGHLFEAASDGITGHLAQNFAQYVHAQPQEKVSMQEYHAGTPATQALYEDAKYAFRTLRPFIQKWGRLPDDYDAIYQQMLEEMQRSDFASTLRVVTVWGSVPSTNPTTYDR